MDSIRRAMGMAPPEEKTEMEALMGIDYFMVEWKQERS